MKLTQEEKQLRDEIAKKRFIRGAIDPKGCFDAAEKFIQAQREKHKEDKASDYEEWGCPPNIDVTNDGGNSPQ